MKPTENSSLLRATPREAYAAGDIEASKMAHARRIGHTEAHSTAGDRVKAIIFGGLDGILTSFAIVAGAAGGGMGYEVALILGVSNIFADALSMGVGEALSSKAHNDYVMWEKGREEWEMVNNPQGEIDEMVELYEGRGMNREDAQVVVETMARYKDFFVDVMMVEELGLQVPDGDENYVLDGFIMFCSFAAFGAMPLVGYAIFPFFMPELGEETLFLIACVVTAATLFVLGASKSLFGTTHWLNGGLEMLVLGCACASLSYYVSGAVDELVSGQKN